MPQSHRLNPANAWKPDACHRETEAVVEQEVAPRSYNVSTPGGTLRRNRRNLVQVLEGPDAWW